MFHRTAIQHLKKWKSKAGRKPLILRGARQVGKTTLVDIFAQEFDNYIKLNLEKKEDRTLFEKIDNIKELKQSILYSHNISSTKGETLLFIDEIQNSPEAIKQLRYFYEEEKDLFIIAAGSLLETVINEKISFPVGRVEYYHLHPVSFIEFLLATGEKQSIEFLNIIPLPEYAHYKLLKLFKIYTLLGGMPEIIKAYTKTRDMNALASIYDGLINSYIEDVEKYSKNNTMTQVIRFIIRQSFFETGNRITFQNFGKSNYRSREVGEAFRTLEKTMILQLVYPTTNTNIPIQTDYKKSPKLQLFDTGLINHTAGIFQDFFTEEKITDIYKGKIAEHIVGQELISLSYSPLSKLVFWVRDKKNSQAEVDFVYLYKGLIIPIEVKSGKTGRLRSLFKFIDDANHSLCVRVYDGVLHIQEEKTISGKRISLLNIPFYLINKIDLYLDFILSKTN